MKSFRDLKVGDNLYVDGKPEHIWGMDKSKEGYVFYTCSGRHNSEDKLVERLRCYPDELDGNIITSDGREYTSCELK